MDTTAPSGAAASSSSNTALIAITRRDIDPTDAEALRARRSKVIYAIIAVIFGILLGFYVGTHEHGGV